MTLPQQRRLTAVVALVLLVAGQAGAAQMVGCLDKFPPPVLAFCLVLYARRRGGGVTAALTGSATIAALAWANWLSPPAEGPGHRMADAMLDLFCCGTAGAVLIGTTLAVFATPRRPKAESSEDFDCLALCGAVVVSGFVIGMIASLASP